MKMVGMQSVSSMINTGDVGSQAEYPRASNVLRIPPLGNDDASGSCCTSSLPLNFSMPASASKKESCFSAVPPVMGWNQCVKCVALLAMAHDLAAAATASAVTSSIFSWFL